jgi:hypothetical protein
MPKRVLDFDALWSSDKLAACAPWAQAEYAWLYGLADCNGSFEMTNLRVIWGRVAAIRHALTLQRLEQVFAEFIARGLLFTWEAGGKRYGHWTGSDQPGRLPPPSWRARLERLAPPVPKAELAAFMAQFSQSKIPQREVTPPSSFATRENTRGATQGGSRASDSSPWSRELKPRSNGCLEAPQGQGLGLDKGREVDWESAPISDSSAPNGKVPSTFFSHTNAEENTASSLLAGRGRIPPGQAPPAKIPSQPQAAPAASAAGVAYPTATRPSVAGVPRPACASLRDGSRAAGETASQQAGTFPRRFAPNRSPLPEARVGVGPVVTTGRIRREALERILRREAARRAIPP